MSLPQLDESILALLTLLVFALALAIFGLWLWAISRPLRRLPPPSPPPILQLQPASWGGWTVFLVILLYLSTNLVVGIGYGVVRRAGRVPAAADRPSAAIEPENPQPTAEGADEEEEEESSSTSTGRTAMLLNAIVSVAFLAALPSVLRRSAGITFAELGLSWRDWPTQVRVGAAAALLTVPVVYVVQALSVQIWKVREHPVQKMMEDEFGVEVAVLALVSTVVLAPLVEESLFRGVIQGWLTRLLSGPPPNISAVPATNDAGDEPAFKSPELRADGQPEIVPVEAGADSPGPDSGAPGARRANDVSLPSVLATSLLFAGVHAAQWPAPVGIFFLSIVLGYVYQRTGSLLAAIAAHGVFNACSTLLLLQTLLARAVEQAPSAPEIAPKLQPAVAALVDLWSWWHGLSG